MTIALPGCGVFPGVAYVDRAISEEAGAFRKALGLSGSAESLLEHERQHMFGKLARAVSTARHDDWDHAGAKKVEPSTVEYASQLLATLPCHPVMDVSVDTDGEVFLEWDFGPRRVFSMSVGRDGRVAYAGLLGNRSFHGAEPIGDDLESIVASLRRVVGEEPLAVRPR